MNDGVTLPALPIHAGAAALILDYNERFADVTRRSKRRFERCDWQAQQIDAGARIDLYDVCIAETLDRLERLLEDRVRSRSAPSARRPPQ